jgi:1-deoxy-D-xylulose-5-phosphate reductoisomerase
VSLAYRALREGGTLPAAMNAANEVAVKAFLDERICLSDIPRVIEAVMNDHEPRRVTNLEVVLDTDREARREATNVIQQIAREATYPVLRLV